MTPNRRAGWGLPFLAALALSCAGKSAAPPPSAAAFASAPAAAVAKAALPVDIDSAPLPVDPAVRHGRLDNGLAYYVRKHDRPEKRASLRLAVNAGSILETDAQRGLAHFIEHMAFNGTRRYQKQEIVDFMERVGMRFGQDANASTSFDETLYTFEVPTDDPAILDRALSMLQQMATEISFEKDELDRERKVVIEEWRLGLGAGMRVMEQLLPVIFKGSLYAQRLPIGTKDVLDHATPDDLRGFYKTWYRPDLMAVVVVGDIDEAKVEARVREVFGQIPKPISAPPRVQPPVPEQGQTLVAIVKDKELPGTTVGVMHKLPHRPDVSARDYRRSIVEGLYHDMMNARLEEQTRVAAPPFLFALSVTQSLVRPMDVFAQMAGVKQGEITQGLAALTREVERVDRHGFTKGELDRAKLERQRRMQALTSEREKLPAAGFADEMVRNFLTDEAMPGIKAELDLHDRYLPTITLSEMNGVARELITEKNRVVLVQAPDDVLVPAQAALLAQFEAVQKETIAPYEDKAAVGPLVSKLRPPGKVVRTQTHGEVGVTEWRLSNGVTVVCKPTDFKNDEVLMGAWRSGGHSLAKDREFLSAVFAAQIIGGSGLGAFDPVDLRKALTGKLASVDPFISELEEGVTGSASPQDLETLLQLVYLSFAAPRRDEPAFSAYRAQLADSLSHRLSDPDEVFVDKRESLIFANHPRRRALQPGDEAKLNLDQMLRFYKQRFGSAGGFTFVFVGHVDAETLLPLALKYLGSLPGKPGTPSKWRDVGARPLTGSAEFAVAQGSEPKSTVSLTFTGPQAYSREEEVLFDATTEAVGIRLREKIREELGATYGVRVDGDLVRRPVGAYRIDVVFSCAPEQVDKATAAVWEVLAGATKDGLPQSYLEKVQAAMRRGHEQGLLSNAFWLGRLSEAWRFATPTKTILQDGALIDALTAARIKDAVGRYFDKKGYVLGVLKPADAGQKRALLGGDRQPVIFFSRAP